MSITKKYQSTKGNYKVTFTLPADVAPAAKSVQILGEFNDWDAKKAPAMKSSKKEYSATVELKPGRYEFRYLIDGLRWENDFSADNYVSSPFAGINNSVLELAAVKAEKVAAPKAAKAPAAKTSTAKTSTAKPAAAKTAKAKVVKPAKAAAPKVEKKVEVKAKKVAAPKTAKPADTATAVKPAAKRGRKPKQA